ncbi:NUDIX hydrolase [Aestuariirhabdus sp. Z084]|uniref:NUDIX hydrolase n=1 Tax=Aestuariirhabdus haliotis TaxID=2918751 RepID=UPI00201B3679|nr:NUDIX domain-containing protein [Aestuariirhabdus haliotis]MCL6417718.1 NUDIX hydrolase [Aestuariirhabdus haliotis]MCL6421651.1 NUDIX hydrolase [Aestuariirhabdus haliotis]
MNERDFLRDYDKNSYSSPLVTVDAALFTYQDECLKVLLIQRANHPERGKWALPGGFIDEQADTDLDVAVQRKLYEKTGVRIPYIEQLASFGSNKRDKRGWSVTIAYTALVAYQDCSALAESVSDTRWVPLQELPQLKLAFDHEQLILCARERLRQKALYSIVPAYTLPEHFTLPALQQVHEALIGKPLQKKSFRRRIEQAELLIDTGKKRAEGGRPATLYRMKPGAAEHFFLRNLEL